jgi:putative spermidine/putrescine transport system permease protein
VTVVAPGRADAASAAHPAAPESQAPARRRRLSSAAWPALGLAPFAVYVLVFLVLPTVIAVGSGMFDGEGHFTLDNVAALGDPVILRAFWNSTWVSLLTAVVGAVVGAVACYALLGLPDTGFVRTTVDAASGVLAQFGGVMLAFMWIATIGLQGVATTVLADVFGISLYANGPWIYGLPGLIPAYLTFQIPLMVITFSPALAALKPAWLEANLTLGGTRAGFWMHVGIPVLAPSFLASTLLLFANAFSSYATAAALASQGAPIVPLQIRTALTSETVLGRQNLAGALALGMIVVVAVVMWAYSAIQRRAARWQS